MSLSGLSFDCRFISNALRTRRRGEILSWMVCAVFWPGAIALVRGADEPAASPAAVAGTVNYEQQILPILRRNCLACHNASQAEGDLILESRAGMEKGGGSGPAITAGQGETSLIYRVTAGLEEPSMPPDDNKVGAKKLTPEELALLKKWLDEGAIIPAGTQTEVLHWQPINADRMAVLAASIAVDGKYVAAGRGTQLEIYHVPSRRVVARPVDPSVSERWKLPPATDVDAIQSIDFSPNGTWLATGGFRTIKLWQKTTDERPWLNPSEAAEARVWGSPAHPTKFLVAYPDGRLQLIDSMGKTLADVKLSVSYATATPSGWWVCDREQHLVRLHPESLQVLATTGLAETTATAVAALDADGETHVVVGTEQGRLLSWKIKAGDLPSGPPQDLGPPATTDAHTGRVTVVQSLSQANWPESSRNLRWISAGIDGRVRVWDAGWQAVKTCEQGSEVRDLVVFPSTPQCVVGDANGGLKWWDLAEAKLVREEAQSDQRRNELSRAERTVALAKQQAENATGDKKKAEERLKQETDAVTQSEKELQEADKKLEEAKKVKTEKDALVAEKTAPVKMAEDVLATAKAELEMRKTAVDQADASAKEGAQQEFKAAEAKVAAAEAALMEAKKPLEEAQKGATDAQTALDTATKDREASAGLVERNKENRTRAEAALQQQDQLLTQRNSDVAAAETSLKEQLAASQASRDGVMAMVLDSADPNVMFVLRQQKTLETRQATSGEIWEAQATELTRGPLVPIGSMTVLGDGGQRGPLAVSGLPVWRLARTIGDPEDRYTLVDRVLSLDFSGDSKLLASGGGEPSRSGEVKLWNVADGSLVRQWPDLHSDTVFAVRFSPDSRVLASGAADRFAKTCLVETGEVLRVFEGHTHYVQGVSWRADGRLLATAGADKTVKFWDPLTAEQANTLSEAKKEVTGVTFLGLENRIALAAGDGQVVALLSNGQEKKGMAGASSFLHALDATVDGQWIVAAGEDRIVRLWSKDGTLIAESKPGTSP